MIDACMDGWMYEQIDRQIDGWMDGLAKRKIDQIGRQIDIDVYTDRCIHESVHMRRQKVEIDDR